MTIQQTWSPAASAGKIKEILLSDANARYWPLAGIAIVLALQFTMIFGRSINWDEYYHYSQVQLFADGTLSQPLQSFLFRVFGWLPALPGTEIDHIIAGRIVMFACEIVTAAMTALVAARFSNRTAGLLCALCYLSAGYVMQHGFSFRPDPIDAALLMSALCILTYTELGLIPLAGFGLLLALAAMFTIKCVLYAPAFLGIAWLRWHEHKYRWAYPIRLAVAGSLAMAFFALLYAYNSQMVVAGSKTGETLLKNSWQEMVHIGVPVFWPYMVRAALLSQVFVVLLVLLPFALWNAHLSRPAKAAIAGLLLPVTALYFYNNTLPYFYAFILPPVAAACAVSIATVTRRYHAALLAVLFAGSAVAVWKIEPGGIIDRQRTLLAAAQTMFPAKISYFGFSAMLARDRKANVYMTPWGDDLYKHGAVPSMRATMQREAVPLAIESGWMFTHLLRTKDTVPEFLPADAAALRATYLPFWGPFWVAGKIIPANARRENATFLVPGPYALSGGAVEIDGRTLYPGQAVKLDRGSHRLTAIGGKMARLTWGDHLHKPAEPPPPRPYWTPF